ncbi:MAG: DUF6092 family protein [Candidatus Bathyarchaeia archaeon]
MISTKPSGNEYLFEIAIFLATSARNCVDEPPLYGPFRLLDALSKLVDLPKYVQGLEEDPFLQEIKALVDEKKFLVMYDVEGFKRGMDEIVEKFAKELKRRSLETK